MPKTRGSGEGALYRYITPQGKVRWRIEVLVGRDADGKRQRLRRTFPTRREAADALATALSDQQKGQLVVTPDQTVADYLRQWLRDVATPTTWGRTSQHYRWAIEGHAIPAIGHLKLGELRPQHVQALYASEAPTLSPQSILHLHRCLHTALEKAVDWGLVARNPIDRVDPPRVQRRTIAALSPEQARAFVQAAKGDDLEALWVLWITTGMREGELLALRWTDLDLEAGAVQLQRALSYVRGVGWQEKDAKSHQGRKIDLAAIAIAVLRRHRVRQAEARLRAGSSWRDTGLVFTTEIGTHLLPTNLRKRHWLSLLERAGLPKFRMYDLRHSAASLMLALGVSPKVVAEMLGHSSVNLTLNTYSHTTPTLHGDAVRQLNDLLAGES